MFRTSGRVVLAEPGGVLDHGDDVAQVVVVDLGALQLDEQHVARGHGVGLELQPAPQIDAVVEPEGVEVEVDAVVVVGAAATGRVAAVAKELALAAHRGHRHLAVLGPAEPAEHGRHGLRGAGERRQVDVAVGAPAERGVAAVLAYGEAAEQAHHHTLGARRVDDDVGLGEHAHVARPYGCGIAMGNRYRDGPCR